MPTEKDFKTLDSLSCNTEVHLQLLTPTQTIRLRSRLIGIDPGRAVILSLGHDKSWQNASAFIRERQTVIIRVVNSDEQDANILAFRSTIQQVVSTTGRWLIVTYPRELQTVALRQHSRVPIHIEANLTAVDSNEPIASGHLKDISIKGGAFVAAARSDLIIDSQFQLNIALEEEMLSIAVTLKNQQELEPQSGLAQYGFVLGDDEQMNTELIQKIVLQHLTSTTK
ncbi:flagellar brake protein [Shewanella fidelis]|uniref:PilZ domain-containing protein n=1 Tax=Shewanella fidelis TaxID=173509 RepID=A0AAW8NRM5_9GAMM|nr:PilZ domain-containing protein [Shewanella fidelis]MDR8525562.1 PilZ domain-containing protein [Shewanella fidelis]MDW4813119.1 PilZ domain-containing protein [Shewanella fidelis]MDW4817001.1 PilZ domain-containing protein [Shewanella fidelis]MDW4820160.1 PilZ domain-containing protein [Shewanella fidelis]MDW4825584.1 PilZ domain-containing protein [Shewanella fidelis]